MKDPTWKTIIGVIFFSIALFFVYRSFYGMRIPEEDAAGTDTTLVLPHNIHGDKVLTQEKELVEKR